MELDFDKEMDALLRRAAKSGTEAEASGEHLDPDAIAAFAAGSLPAPARDVFGHHLAECDRCRKMLALTASFHEETEAGPAVSRPEVLPAAVPWYKKFFGLPALAYTMGALALLLSGFIGYSVLQRSSSTSPEVSQVYDNEPQRGGPSISEESVPQAAANSNSTASVPFAANSAGSPPSGMSNAATANTAAAGPAALPTPVRSSDDTVATGTGAAPPPPPPAPTNAPEQQPVMGRTTVETEKPRAAPKIAKEEPADSKLDVVTQDRNEQKKMKDQAPAAALSAKSAARRDQEDRPAASTANTNPAAGRVIGGKTFEQKNGAWYDSGYRGQKTTKVRRGSEEYVRLDAGLRSIADTLGGTVIIVWSGKAYRIQ